MANTEFTFVDEIRSLQNKDTMITRKNRFETTAPTWWPGLFFLLFLQQAQAQMFVANDTLYGNEWIDYNRSYFKIKVAEDGVYRIGYQALNNAGINVSGIEGTKWRLYHNGRQVPIFTTTNAAFGNGDFIEFWGQKNRIEIDSQLFDLPDAEIVNPWYSLFNDTSAYFLTWADTGSPLRYTTPANDLNNLPAAETYCWQMTQVIHTSAHIKRRIEDQVTFSWFNGEGFCNGENTTSSFVIPNPPQVFPNGPGATLHLRYATNLGQHKQQLLLHDSLYADDEYFGWKVLDKSINLPLSRFNNGLKVEIKGLSTANDRHALAGYTLRYPGTFNFGAATQQFFDLDASAGAKYLEITAPNMLGAAPPVLFDYANLERITGNVQGNTIRFKLGASSKERQLVLAGQATGIKTVAQLTPVTFRDYSQDRTANYIILSHKGLFKDPLQQGKNHVEAYADYRSSAEGGSHKVAVVDVTELYEQFAYGVNYHPIAVRNFAHFIKKNWDNPEYLMVIGKGLNYNLFRSTANQALFADSLFFVPMYGTPAVDMSFLMRRGGLSTPIMAVGRIAVSRPVQVGDYLAKLIEHEAQQASAEQSIEARAWMKRVIHISGGKPGDAQLIRSFSENMGTTLRNNRFGADITTLFKTSNDPIQSSPYETLRSLVKEGVSLWMIYGHSAATGVDFDIGGADSYKNTPRYPYMMVMGCFTGICAIPQRSLGEEYILSPKSGAIAYSASVNYGFIDAFHTYGNSFYSLLGGDYYGKSLGQVFQRNVDDLQGSAYTHLIAILHQNTLQGDPALRLQTAPGPDYIIDPQSVTFNPNPIPLDQANYRVGLDIANIGEHKAGKITVKISEQQPDNSLRLLVQDTISAPALRSRLDYQVPTNGSKTGFSRIMMSVDAANQMEELPATAELNNDLNSANGEKGVEIYFYSNDIQPVYPADCAIVSNATPKLSASTLSNAKQALRFRFELDTVETFNSPFKKNYEIEQTGGLLQWQPNVPLKDSTTYYWRVARDSLVNGIIPWRSASFTYIANSPPGWSQSDYGQYIENTLSNLGPISGSRNLEFVNNTANILVKVGYQGANIYYGLNNSFYEGSLGDYWFGVAGVTNGGICVMVHNPATGRVIWNPPGGPYNSAPAQRQHFFYFRGADSLQRVALMEFLKNDVPDKATVGFIAFNRPQDQLGYDPENWAKDSISYGQNLFQVLEAQGAREVRYLANYTGVPPAYGFIYRKNDPNFSAVDTIISNPNDVVEMHRDFEARWFSGQMQSKIIGPVHKWGSLHFGTVAKDDPSDGASLSVYGLSANQQSDSLLMVFDNPVDTSLSAIQAARFPYLRLQYSVFDTTDNRTATPLAYMRVLFTPVPEGALLPQVSNGFYADTLDQGDVLKANIAFANISDAAFDSLAVRIRIENQATPVVIQQQYKPLAVGDSLRVAVQVPTAQLSGNQRMVLEVNPDAAQPELYPFNNVWFRPFYVKKDNRNPLLDVTFDGQHLLDGDLISPKPWVHITLKDDNRFLAMSDTNLFDLKLLMPDGSTRSLLMSDPEVRFFPADPGKLPEKNHARIEWRPTFVQDGDYRLQVNGRDATGNESAALDYSINFKVITKSSLSNLLNYPNPFSTNTCFIYTMTGAESPVAFKLQIMTVSGKIVREVGADEFGDLQAGTHQSNFCWDGKDQFGDQLANGVYLYRVVARKADGTPFEFFENNAVDGYFKGGFGKMVLMR